MPRTYNKDHMVDEFGRVIPYDSLEGAFVEGTTNEVKQRTLEKNDSYRNDGSYVAGSRVKDYLDDTMGFYGETKKNGEGRKMYVGDIHAHYSKETGIGEICTRVITDRNDIKESPRFISARIDEKQYNAYMASNDAQRLRLASDYLKEIRLESTRNRTAEVKDIRMQESIQGVKTMTANIDGEDIHREVSDAQMVKMVLLSGEKKEKAFAKMFDCKDVKTVPGEKSSLESQIAAAVTKSGSKQETKQVSIKQASGEASGISDSASVKAGQTSAPTQGKAADLAAASFEQISQSIDAKESVSQGVHR